MPTHTHAPIARPSTCPRCDRALLRTPVGLECWTHGEVWAEPQGHERVAAHEPIPGRLRNVEPIMPKSPAWTPHERELWRRAEAGEPIPDPNDALQPCPYCREMRGLQHQIWCKANPDRRIR